MDIVESRMHQKDSLMYNRVIFQHTPAMQSGRKSLLHVHDETLKLVKEFALQEFCKEIANHLFQGTILNGEFVVLYAIGDEIESTMNVFGSLAAQLLSILFEEHLLLLSW
jgi:hypothetical protein